MQFITAQEFIQKNHPGFFFVLDIRESYEREVFAIPSVHIPMHEVCGRVEELPERDTVVIMCNSGKRAEALCNMLECDYGKANLLVLEGGSSALSEKMNS